MNLFIVETMDGKPSYVVARSLEKACKKMYKQTNIPVKSIRLVAESKDYTCDVFGLGAESIARLVL